MLQQLLTTLKSWHDSRTPDSTDDKNLYDQLTEFFKPTHRHLKRGTDYTIVGQVRIQCSVMPVQDGDMLYLYRGTDGVFSARHPDEFNDGRFERIVRDKGADMYDKME